MEEWKPITNYEEHYSVSSLGNVPREKGGIGLCTAGRILKPKKIGNGYLGVNLCKNGSEKCFRIHRLVAREFLGECPPGKEVNHIQGDKHNNRLSNLEYLTKSENVRHSYKLGKRKIPCGVSHGMSKINEKDVVLIRERYRNGETLKNIAKDFCISFHAVSRIKNYKTWKHVQ